MSSYYIDQIKTYNDEYDEALKKLESINTKINSLITAFKSATGTDVEPIKKNLDKLSEELESIKGKITKAQKETNTRATNSDNVYDKALNDHKVNTPSFESSDNKYESTGQRKIYIEEGIIYEEETFKQIPKTDSFNLLEAIGLVNKEYKYITSTLYAGVDEMFQGELKLYPATKKSGYIDSPTGTGGGHSF